MANQNTIADLSTTPASNLNLLGQSIRGTAVASTIDSMFQNNAAILAAFYDSLGGTATVSGTNTLAVSITEDWSAYASGLVLAIKTPNANTGAVTLNVTVPTAGALGDKAIRRQGDSALQSGDMVANGRYVLVYDEAYNSAAGAWVLLNPPAPDASTTVKGKVELATTTEALTGTDTTRAVTPAGLYFDTGHVDPSLTISNNSSDASNDIDVSAFTARDSTDTYNIVCSALTKRVDAAWAVGTNQGGLDTGSVANTTYYIWGIRRSDTAVCDVLFSTSSTSPTMPTNYDAKVLIGEFTRASSTNGIPIIYGKPKVRYSGTAPVFACRAWVNFNGTGTVAIRASGNVSSITDNGTGDYTVNFTTAMPDANYSVVGTCNVADTGSGYFVSAPYNGTMTTGAVRIHTDSSAAATDMKYVSIGIFR